MPWINTSSIPSLSTYDNLQVYCGLDNCLTLEVNQALDPLLSNRPFASRIYDFERALQAPYLEIMLRGFKVDDSSRRTASASLWTRIEHLQSLLDRMARTVWDQGLNPRSPKQLQAFFYKALQLPEVWISQKGERKLSTNREALEKLSVYLHAQPFINCILKIRDLSKQRDVFESEIDSRGRFCTSYNIAGTETGRPSSSSSAFGTGGNAQNIAPSLRYVFIADPSWKLCVIDLEQVEARDVGFFCGVLFNDWSYLDSCESGDLHTNNARLIWPELGWSNDPQRNKELAQTIFYRDFTYRDMAKRGSHLSNYMGTPFTASRALKVPQPIMEDFRSRYCTGSNAAFPCIPRWWTWVAQQIQTTYRLVTPFGRERHFFGRVEDDTTLREAIAFGPQSTTADRMNLGLFRVWKNMPQVQLLAQTYDSITFQYPESADENAIIDEALEHLKIKLVHEGREYVVPGEAKIGWNWSYQSSTNSEGLMKWNPQVPDTRVRGTGINKRIAA